MEELVGRLTALDPDASASLKVIVYFESLIDGHAGVEAFLRGAAILAGVPAGAVSAAAGIRMRVGIDGTRTDAPTAAPVGALTHALGYGDDGAVWIERAGAAHANDAMVLERLASGLRMTLERLESRLPTDNGVGVEVLLGADSSPGDRERAARRLHLDDTTPLRAVALPPGDAAPSQRELSTVMPTVVGPARAVIERAGRTGSPARAGLGGWGRLADLAVSWSQAVTALRFTDDTDPVVEFDQLGPLSLLADAVDAQTGVIPDVALLDEVLAVAPWAPATLTALCGHDSVRAAATALNVHHSTMQSRCEQLEGLLGYGLRSQTGRTRATLGLAAHRLAHTRFDA